MKKQTIFWIYSLVIIGAALSLTSSCSKKDSNNNNIPGGTVKDIDGNVYHTVTIGVQVWMVENLKTTRYNDGSAIPLVTDSAAWVALSTPGYCWCNNDAATYKNTYGALYNWFTVKNRQTGPNRLACANRCRMDNTDNLSWRGTC